MEVFPDTGEVDEGPLASCRMDGSIQNSALYPRGLEPIPGAKTLHPGDPRCQRVTRSGRGYDHTWSCDIPGPSRSFILWVHASCCNMRAQAGAPLFHSVWEDFSPQMHILSRCCSLQNPSPRGQKRSHSLANFVVNWAGMLGYYTSSK